MCILLGQAEGAGTSEKYEADEPPVSNLLRVPSLVVLGYHGV